MKLDLKAYLPASYIPDISERLVAYQRFAALETPSETDLLIEEIEDRYGDPPPEVLSYAEVMRLRCMLRDFGVVKFDARGEKINFSFSALAPIDVKKVVELVQKEPSNFKFQKNMAISMVVEAEVIKDPEKLYKVCVEELGFVARLPLTSA